MRFVLFLIFLSPALSSATEYLIGEVKAYAEADVMAQVDGLVSGTYVNFGEHVQESELLLAFESTDAKLNLDLARSKSDLAEVDSQLKSKQLSRLKRLNKKKALADSDLEEQLRQTQISRSQLQVELKYLSIAQRYLDKHRVHAPFSASVVERYVEVGQWVSIGNPLYRLVDISRVLVEARLVEQDVAQLRLGQTIEIYIPTVDRKLHAKIQRIADAPQRDGSGYRIELELDNPGGMLKPGYRAELKISEGGE